MQRVHSLEPSGLSGQAYFLQYTRQQLEKFDKEYRATLKQMDEAQLHDLRVAIRRLSAVLLFWEQLVPGFDFQKERKSLRRLMTPLGKLRDALLQQKRLQSSGLSRSPGLREYLAYLADKINQSQVETKNAIKSFPFHVFHAKLHRSILKTLQHFPGTGMMVEVLPFNTADWRKMSKEKLALILKLESDVLTKNDDKAFHQMRIAVKKYRYFLEIIQPMETTIKEENLVALANLQTRMGDIHDLDVMAWDLLKFDRRLYPHHTGYRQIAEYVLRLRNSRIRQWVHFITDYAGFKKIFELK